MSIKWVLKLMWLWPPFLGAGISIKSFNKDYTDIVVQMKLHFWNKNYVGTHFGGSLYTMTDPFFMLIMMNFLGKGFHVWDKFGSIRYRKPGRETVYAHFKITHDKLKKIKDHVQSKGIHEETFQVTVTNKAGDTIAEIEKLLYIKCKDAVTRQNN